MIGPPMKKQRREGKDKPSPVFTAALDSLLNADSLSDHSSAQLHRSSFPSCNTHSTSSPSSKRSLRHTSSFSLGELSQYFGLQQNSHPPATQPKRVAGCASTHMDRIFRWRDWRRRLEQSLSPEHHSYVASHPIHHILWEKLPKPLTRHGFALRLLVLAFHFILRFGFAPLFWAKCNRVKILEHLEDKDLVEDSCPMVARVAYRLLNSKNPPATYQDAITRAKEEMAAYRPLEGRPSWERIFENPLPGDIPLRRQPPAPYPFPLSPTDGVFYFPSGETPSASSAELTVASNLYAGPGFEPSPIPIPSPPSSLDATAPCTYDTPGPDFQLPISILLPPSPGAMVAPNPNAHGPSSMVADAPPINFHPVPIASGSPTNHELCTLPCFTMPNLFIPAAMPNYSGTDPCPTTPEGTSLLLHPSMTPGYTANTAQSYPVSSTSAAHLANSQAPPIPSSPVPSDGNPTLLLNFDSFAFSSEDVMEMSDGDLPDFNPMDPNTSMSVFDLLGDPTPASSSLLTLDPFAMAFDSASRSMPLEEVSVMSMLDVMC